MLSWSSFSDTFGTDPALANLDARQIHAVIDVLLLVMYADNKATLLEKAEFEDAICALPVLGGKRDVVHEHTAGATVRIKAAGADESRAIAESAARALPDASVREKVFRMATSLACADVLLAAPELAALKTIAGAFGLSDSAAQAIIDAHD